MFATLQKWATRFCHWVENKHELVFFIHVVLLIIGLNPLVLAFEALAIAFVMYGISSYSSYSIPTAANFLLERKWQILVMKIFCIAALAIII